MNKPSSLSLDREDHLELQFSDERLARLTQESELLLERTGIAAKIRAATSIKLAIIQRCSDEYALSSNDTIDIDTGEIKRASVSELPPPSLKAL